jgi:hypothetical protein
VSRNVRPRTRRTPGYTNKDINERKLTEAIDDLAMFEELQASVIPQLRALIKKGASSDEILEAGRAIAVARLVSMAALEPETNLGAIKELLDRVHGKSTEKKEFSHRLGKLKEEEMDAMLLSALSEDDNNEEN